MFRSLSGALSGIEQRYRKSILTKQLSSASHPILDIGSGSRPLPLADVLCDAFVQPTKHRVDQIKTDGKPFVVCAINFLPFKPNVFAFANCTHVLEHLPDPQGALEEMKRVAKNGYIETPGWFGELVLFGNPAHIWIIKSRNGKLSVAPSRRAKIGYHTVMPMGFIFAKIFQETYFFKAMIAALDLVFPNLFLVRHNF